MSYYLYKNKLQENENLLLDHIQELVFPDNETKYYYVNLVQNQDLMEVAVLLYDDVSQWKMLAILNNIDDPMSIEDKRIIALRPEYLDEITNVS